MTSQIISRITVIAVKLNMIIFFRFNITLNWLSLCDSKVKSQWLLPCEASSEGVTMMPHGNSHWRGEVEEKSKNVVRQDLVCRALRSLIRPADNHLFSLIWQSAPYYCRLPLEKVGSVRWRRGNGISAHTWWRSHETCNGVLSTPSPRTPLK